MGTRAESLQYYTESKGQALINNSKWANRSFKPFRILERDKKKETFDSPTWYCSYNCRSALFSIWHKLFNPDEPTGFLELWENLPKHKDDAGQAGVYSLLSNTLRDNEAPQDAFDECFCEEMFVPLKPNAKPKPASRPCSVQESDMLAQLKEKFADKPVTPAEAFRPGRPPMSAEMARTCLNSCIYKNRTFQTVKALEVLGFDDLNMNSNLLTYIGDATTRQQRTFIDLFNHIAIVAPITWNGIIADLAWNGSGYYASTFSSKFIEGMFLLEEYSDKVNENPTPVSKTKLIELSEQPKPLSVGRTVKLISNSNNLEILKIKSNVRLKN